MFSFQQMMDLQVSEISLSKAKFCSPFSLVEGKDYSFASVEVTILSTAEIDSIFCTEVNLNELLIDDVIVENEEHFQLKLVYPEMLIGAPDSISVLIKDNDGKQQWW